MDIITACGWKMRDQETGCAVVRLRREDVLCGYLDCTHIYTCGLYITKGAGRGEGDEPKIIALPAALLQCSCGGGALCYDGLSAIETCQDVAEKTPRSRSERTKDIG